MLHTARAKSCLCDQVVVFILVIPPVNPPENRPLRNHSQLHPVLKRPVSLPDDCHLEALAGLVRFREGQGVNIGPVNGKSTSDCRL